MSTENKNKLLNVPAPSVNAEQQQFKQSRSLIENLAVVKSRQLEIWAKTLDLEDEGDEEKASSISLLGKDLNVKEYKLILGLSQLLFLNNANEHATNENYLAGETIRKRNGRTNPVIKTTNFELAKAFSGLHQPQDYDIKTSLNTLVELSKKQFYFNYKESTQEGKNKYTKVIEEVSSVIPFIRIERTEGEEGRVINIEIELNSVFNSFVKKNFVLMPININRLLSEATPKGRLNVHHYVLFHILLLQQSHNRQVYKISKRLLLEKIAPKELALQKKGRYEAILKDAIETAVNVNLLEKAAEETLSKEGEPMLVFTIKAIKKNSALKE
jgi:hypothetical protein